MPFCNAVNTASGMKSVQLCFPCCGMSGRLHAISVFKIILRFTPKLEMVLPPNQFFVVYCYLNIYGVF